MKVLFRLILITIVLFLAFQYFIGPWGAYMSYRGMVSSLFDRAGKTAKVFTLPSAEPSLKQALEYYSTNYPRFREMMGYPKYILKTAKRTPNGHIQLKMREVIPADREGASTVIGAHFVYVEHQAEMKLWGPVWKVLTFTLHETSATDFSPSQVKFWDLKSLDPAQFKLPFFGSKEKGGGSAIPAIIPQKIPEGMKSFRLNNGTTVTGKVITEDAGFYTLEDAAGKQVFVFKEDLA